MISAKPTPDIKIGLISYRDRGDAYITKVFDLSADIDKVYSNLQEFQANGGGDGPESVNQALNEAVNKLTWSSDKNVLKLVFLVGDAPPHMDYKDDVKYQDTCQQAVRKDLIINTVQCGNVSGTAQVWKDIADRGEGKFVAISQTGDMEMPSTPMDAELATLKARIRGTSLAYGSDERRDGFAKKSSMVGALSVPVMAERMLLYGKKCRERSSGGRG
jgi:hypothetical protein